MAGKIVLLDSCIVIDLQRGNQEAINKVYEFEQENIFVTPIVIAEFYRGARDKQELAKCRKLIAKFNLLSLNEDVVQTFTDFFDQFSISHRPSIPDMLIAAAAINYNIPLYTHNKRDFQFIPGIQFI
jgi:predicted nucleic acid-binding protein